jgi:hypothetical protein
VRANSKSLGAGIGAWIGLSLVVGCYSGRGDVDAAGGADGGDGTADDDGADGADDGSGSDDGTAEPPAQTDQVALVGLRRLTAAEYDASVRDVLYDEASNAALLLPADPRTPFDNDYTAQIPSEALVEAAELLASDAADRLLEDPDRIAMLVPCAPSGPGDEACLEQFATELGRRLLRRPLADAEIQILLHGADGEGAVELAVTENDFDIGVHTVVRTLLQDPEFLYRVEIGTAVEGVPGMYKLSDHEMASRLSFFLWGSTPADWLLDRAEEGGLSTPADVTEAATMMLADERALDRMDRFHAMWLGYETLPFGGELADAMKAESRALLQRVAFDDGLPWQELFRSAETFVNDELAAHYGLAPPGTTDGAWVPYGDTGRRGLLSHGTFLSNGGKFGDTSPVQRGVIIRTRVFCQEIPPPPPGVDPDQAPGDGAAICKEDRYAVHRTGGCAACHEAIDPVGFGLEQYGPAGQFRTMEVDNPDTPDDESQCPISGAGSLSGVGDFSGPAELADLALEAGYLDDCVKQQMYRFLVGRYALDANDEAFLQHVEETLGDGDFTLEALLLQYVGSESFGYRIEDEG